MTPPISLVYSPGLANGVLGAGWNLAFGSRIDRISSTRGLDAVEESEASRFLVDGVELVEVVNGSYRRIQNDHTVFNQHTGFGSVITTGKGNRWAS